MQDLPKNYEEFVDVLEATIADAEEQFARFRARLQAVAPDVDWPTNPDPSEPQEDPALAQLLEAIEALPQTAQSVSKEEQR